MKGYLENSFNFLLSNELNLYYCGRRIKTLDHSYGPEVRQHYLLMYCVDGSAILKREDEEIRFGAHDLYVMFPNEKINYTTLPGSHWTSWWVGIYGSLTDSLMEMLGVTKDNPFIHIRDTYTMEYLMKEIYDTSLNTDTSSKMKCVSLLYELFSFLMKDAGSTYKSDIISDAQNIIEHNLGGQVSVADLAEKLNINPSYLTRIFKQKLSKSPKEYIIDHKIKRAKELLKYTDVSITDIARSVGFDDPLYFSRLFKKRTNLTPTEYRLKKSTDKVD